MTTRELDNNELLQTIKEQANEIEALKSVIEKLNVKPSNLYVADGATPMTIAEMVVRECKDEEILEDIIYYIEAYLSRECNKAYLRESD